MKRYLLALGCLFTVATIQAQTKTIRDFRNKYKGSSETESIKVGGFALKLAGLCLSFDEDDDSQALKYTINNVKRVKLYNFSNIKGETINPDDIIDLKNTLCRNDHFDVLMEVRDKNEQIHILNRSETEEELGDVVMLVQDQDNLLIVNLNTTLKISDVNRLIKQFASK